MQNEIDQLHREHLTLEMLSCVLRNQLKGVPSGKELRLQKRLLDQAGCETLRLDQAIETLVKLRDKE